MKLTLMRSLLAAAILVSASAVAQTSGAPSTALPAAPSAANDPPALGTGTTGSKIGAINVEQAIFASNEGQRDFDALSKKLEPKQTELKTKSDEIDQKQKSLERSAQDAQEDARNQENEIAQRILQKMAPLIVKYAGDNGYGMIIDTSSNNQWPNGPVLWHGAALDITKPVVDAYNAQSGVAPPAPKQGGTGTKPSGGLSKPSAPAATKPATTQPPSK